MSDKNVDFMEYVGAALVGIGLEIDAIWDVLKAKGIVTEDEIRRMRLAKLEEAQKILEEMFKNVGDEIVDAGRFSSPAKPIVIPETDNSPDSPA